MNPQGQGANEAFQNVVIHKENFAYRDLIGIDRWEPWTVVFTLLTTVGTLTTLARYRFVGAECRFQIQFSAATSVASVAGTTYFALPVTAKGYGGQAVMDDDTTNVVVDNCKIKVSTSRCYLPTQPASSDVFVIAGWYEIAP